MRRVVLAFAGIATLVVAAVAVPAYPAAAATTAEPVAIAVGRSGDVRVLQVGGDGKSNSSPIVMSPYLPNTDAASSRQRWSFERVTGSGIPTFAYRVKNPATGKCLNSAGATPANGAPIILYTCIGTPSTTNEIWWMDTNPAVGGAHFRNLRDSRCLDITGANTANNAPLESYGCVETAWNEMFETRTGSFNCIARDSDWQTTAGLCVSTLPTSGVLGSWFNAPSTIAYKNPSTYVLSNEIRSRMIATVVNTQGTQTGDVQLGWRALRASTSTGGVTYNAYWQEYGNNVEEYHAISALDPLGDPNGSDSANGTQHTYLLLASTTANQWDLFYDFNFVATTARQSGGRANFVETGVQSRYIDALTQAQPFEFRVQLMNPAGVWVKPTVVQTALGASKECGMFPTWKDFSGGAGNNQPPWCLSIARTLTGAKTEVDTTVVSKPTNPVSLTAVPPARQTPPAGEARTATSNGVDQAALDRCIASDPAKCLQSVPGLLQCVQQHLRCHASAAVNRPTANAKVTADDAIKAARNQIAGGATAVTRTTLGQADPTPTAHRGDPADTPVYLVTGDAPVRSWVPGSDATYDQWTAAISATTGDLLYARLSHRR